MKNKQIKNIEIEISEFNPQKIGTFPEDIEKLIWRALLYKSKIKIFEKEYKEKWNNYTFDKLQEYKKAFINTRNIIKKQCKRKGLKIVNIVEWII